MRALDRLLIVVAVFLVHVPAIAQQAINIREPTDGERVCTRHWVKGETAQKIAPILIIHPVSTQVFWAQEPATPLQNGKWEVYAHFGRPNMDVGERFQVLAYVAPRIRLSPGQQATEVRPRQQLDHWPDEGEASNLVTVSRDNCLAQQ
jgi:hypothetical protein